VGPALVLGAVHEEGVGEKEAETQDNVHISLNSERGLISLRENVELTDDPEEGKEDDAARHHRGVELDTPDAG